MILGLFESTVLTFCFLAFVLQCGDVSSSNFFSFNSLPLFYLILLSKYVLRVHYMIRRISVTKLDISCGKDSFLQRKRRVRVHRHDFIDVGAHFIVVIQPKETTKVEAISGKLIHPCFLACSSSASFNSLKTPVFATPPVMAAPTTSFAKPNGPTWCNQYVTYLAFTSISAIRGSLGLPSCFPSPRSPNHAFAPLDQTSLIRGSLLEMVVALPVIDTQS